MGPPNMPLYRYTAIDGAGDITQGTLEATDEAALLLQIRRLGQIPMRAEPADKVGLMSKLLQFEVSPRRSLRREDVAEVTRELATMLAAGQDLDRALRFMVEVAPNRRIATVIDQVRAAVRDGGALATALARHPESFSRLYVGLVRAGEAGGTLAATLERLALMLERERSLRATLSSALIYPCVLVVAAIGSITLLLTQVVPQFVPLFEQSGAALPRPTQILIDLGDLASGYGLYALLGIALLTVAMRELLRHPGLGLVADRAMLHVPVVGYLLREVLAARFCRTLGTLLNNGVPLIGALAVVRETLGNLAGVEALDRATLSAKGGAGLSGPLQAAAVFPARTIHLLRLGEETAQLGPMALRAAAIHEENTRIGAQRLIALLVPAITLVMGAAVGGIIAALLLAMLSLNDLAG